jgi:hypothetical protein
MVEQVREIAIVDILPELVEHNVRTLLQTLRTGQFFTLSLVVQFLDSGVFQLC